MASPLRAPGLQALYVPDDLSAVGGTLIQSFPSSAPGDTAPSLLQTSNARKPVMTEPGIGTKKALTWDGVGDMTVNQPGYLYGVTGATAYAVMQTTSTLALTLIGWCIHGAFTNGAFLGVGDAAQGQAGRARWFARRTVADASSSVYGPVVNDGLPHVLCGTVNYVTREMNLYVDGTLASTITGAFTSGNTVAGMHRLAAGCEPASLTTNQNVGLSGMWGVYSGIHDAASRAEVHSWVQDHGYGITVSDYQSPPTAVPNLRTTSLGTPATDIAWDAATDNVAVTGYQITTIAH